MTKPSRPVLIAFYIVSVIVAVLVVATSHRPLAGTLGILFTGWIGGIIFCALFFWAEPDRD